MCEQPLPENRSTSWLGRWLAPRCAICGLAPGQPVCEFCEADFLPATAARCERCAIRLPGGSAGVCGPCLSHPPHYDQTLTLADYAAPIAGMVAALKFAARIDLSEVFGRLLARREGKRPVGDHVVAVPLSFEREAERGYNQSLAIARTYARCVGVPLLDSRLLRVRHTPPQQALARAARRRNVRGAFGITGSLDAATVVVIDDVMTTGSTLDEVATTLKRAGATRVLNRVVARTP